MKEIADRIRETRLQRGMTQQDLADAIGLKNRSSINKIEKDTYELGLDNIKRIAKALNVDPDYLVFGDRDEKKEEIDYLMSKLTENQKDAVLAFLRSITEGR
jgi:transcriptional regulator with XRE-family HTH domain